MSERVVNCRTCHHWRMNVGAPSRIGDPVPGVCLAHPPGMIVLVGPQGPQIRTQYPEPTSAFFACGEYKPEI